MICDSCVNVIMRTFQNGGQDPYTVRVCSLDGAHMTYQLKECSRKEEKKAQISLDPTPYINPEYLKAEQDARDAQGPPMTEKERNSFNKKRGKPRGKRK